MSKDKILVLTAVQSAKIRYELLLTTDAIRQMGQAIVCLIFISGDGQIASLVTENFRIRMIHAAG